MKLILSVLLLLLFSLNLNAQCEWNSFFPFSIGNSKFDVTTIKVTNPTVTDTENKSNLDFDKYSNGYKKYDYLKDSVYINVFNLRFIDNKCFTGNNNHIQLTLSDDKLYKGKVVLEYNDYDIMKKQYDELITLVPRRYIHTFSSERTYPKTGEKIGERLILTENECLNQDDIWNDYVSISFDINFVKKWDEEKKEHYMTNKIENYSIEITVVDLRNSKLTRKGY